MSRRYAAIFFDLDGTLVSERTGVHEARLAAGRTAVEHGVDGLTPESFAAAAETAISEIMAEHGHNWPPWLTVPVWIDRALHLLDADGQPQPVLEAIAATYRRERIARAAAIPGAREAVETARRLAPIAVITNFTEAGQQHQKIAAAGLAGLFEHVFVSGEVGHAKPDPRIFHHAAATLGVPIAESIHIGNSWESDIEGALTAGASAIWFEEDPRPNVQSPNPTVPRFESLTDVAAHLAG